MPTPTTRTVTLMIIEGERVVGGVGPFEAETPWWQDMEPIARRFPDLAVLRILDVAAPVGAVSGGAVRYLAERMAGAAAMVLTDELAADASHASLHEDELRMPWAEPGGPAADLDWVRDQVEIVGRPVQRRTWNLSAIWSVPTVDGEVWLKCLPSFFRHEGAVLQLLADAPVPEVLARDGHRLLLRAMPGVDGYDASFDERVRLIGVLQDLQRTTSSRISAFLEAGVPDRRCTPLLDAGRAVLTARGVTDPRLWRLVEDVDRRDAALEACGLPDVLVHTDAHSGNARIGPGVGAGIWFDWGDACIGHPLLDVAVHERPGTPRPEELIATCLDSWKRAVPGSDPHRAWQLIRPLAELRGAIVYQGFLDRIEASERIYHEGDVQPCLDRAAALMTLGD